MAGSLAVCATDVKEDGIGLGGEVSRRSGRCDAMRCDAVECARWHAAAAWLMQAARRFLSSEKLPHGYTNAAPGLGREAARPGVDDAASFRLALPDIPSLCCIPACHLHQDKSI